MAEGPTINIDTGTPVGAALALWYGMPKGGMDHETLLDLFQKCRAAVKAQPRQD